MAQHAGLAAISMHYGWEVEEGYASTTVNFNILEGKPENLEFDAYDLAGFTDKYCKQFTKWLREVIRRGT